jgi:hypothetical protein
MMKFELKNWRMGFRSACFFSLLVAGAELPVAHSLEVGVSAVDITPYPSASHDNPRRPGYESEFGRIYLGGYGPYVPVFGSDRWARGVHDPVWARAIAVRDQGNTVIMISTDLPGLVWKYINPARRELSKKFNIPVENIIIASTHNHSGPDSAGYWVTLLRGHNGKYNQRLIQWLIESGTQAIRSLEPAQIKTVTTDHLACIDKDTQDLKREKDCRFPANKAEYANPERAVLFDTPIIQVDKRDPQVLNTKITIQHYTRPGSGTTIGTLINWHNHPDTLGMKGDETFISSDFPHYLREFVEKKLGGKAVYFSGTVGCQIGPGAPVPLWSAEGTPVYTQQRTGTGKLARAFVEARDWPLIRSIGYEIGNEVVQAIQNSAGPYALTAQVQVKNRSVDIAPTNFLHWLATGSVWRFDVEPEDQMVWYWGRCMGRFGCVRSDVALVQIADLSILTGPGEIDPVYLYGRNESTAVWKRGKKTWTQHFKSYPSIAPHLKGPHVAVFGQAQNYLSYQFPYSDFVGALNLKHPNHYEDMVTVNKHFGDDVGNVWHELVGSEYRYNSRRILPAREQGHAHP